MGAHNSVVCRSDNRPRRRAAPVSLSAPFGALERFGALSRQFDAPLAACAALALLDDRTTRRSGAAAAPGLRWRAAWVCVPPARVSRLRLWSLPATGEPCGGAAAPVLRQGVLGGTDDELLDVRGRFRSARRPRPALQRRPPRDAAAAALLAAV